MTDIDAVLSARGRTHGNFTDHARITQNIKDAMHNEKNWHLLTPGQKEALEMQAHKIGRILAGDPHYQDHWDDIAGYAKLATQQVPNVRPEVQVQQRITAAPSNAENPDDILERGITETVQQIAAHGK